MADQGKARTPVWDSAESLSLLGPVVTLGIVAVLFAAGIVASIIADRRDPDSDRKRQERGTRTADAGAQGGDGAGPEPVGRERTPAG